MLKTVDVLIGFTLVMLVLSMAVTVLTQLVSSNLNLRGECLKVGIRDLLRLLDHGLTKEDADGIADLVLRDPLIGEPNIRGTQKRLATTVHREELTKLILGFATDASVTSDKAKQLQAKLQTSLAQNGISDPASVLASVRSTMLELERTAPEMANHQRLTLALLDHAASEFLGKINSWFDQSIDRVSANFTLHTRLVTGLGAAVVAVGLQVDAIALINRLSVDDVLRSQLVEMAVKNPVRFDPSVTAAAPADPKIPPPGPGDGIKNALGNPDFKALAGLGVIDTPGNPFSRWPDALPGVLVSALLLSLGAPFWYEMLKNLIRLRSIVATKDDAQRQERQHEQDRPAPQVSSAARAGSRLDGTGPVLAQGEKGDLEAVG